MDMSATEPADGASREQVFARNYERAEVFADAAVHVIGLCVAVIGAGALIYAVRGNTLTETACIIVYAIGLVAMVGLSAAYNLWPVSSYKWFLRRFDHSAIYLFIAATYTPFLGRAGDTAAIILLIGVWGVALFGIALKLLRPGRYDHVSIGLYLLLGWSGLMAHNSLAALPVWPLIFLIVGGVLYSGGVLVHLSERLRFHKAIWHGMVLAAASFHYISVVLVTS